MVEIGEASKDLIHLTVLESEYRMKYLNRFPNYRSGLKRRHLMLRSWHLLCKHLFVYTFLVVLPSICPPKTVWAQTIGGPFPERYEVTIGKVAVGDLTFHPLFNSLGVEREIAALIYGEGLLRLDETGTPTDGLAYLPIKLSAGRDWVVRL